MNKKYTALGTYIFSGGFTVGVQKYFDVICHFEGDTYGKKMKDRNLPDIETFLKPWPNIPVDFIYCNPPCAVWSNASHGRKTTWYEDERLSCFDDCFDLIHREPTFMAIETVLAGWRKSPEYFLDLCQKANELGYSATIILHDGRYLGLPQVRRRMFVTFHLLDYAWNTYRPLPEIACDWALENPPLEGPDQGLTLDEHHKYLLTHRRPEDSTLLKIHDRLGFRKGVGSHRPVFSSSVCKPGRPSPTLLHCMHTHPTEKRFLTIREMARLTGYPDWWDWDIGNGGPQAKASLIARGVTPTVGGWLAKLVYDSLEQDCFISEPKTMVVDILKGPLGWYDPFATQVNPANQ